MKKIKHLKLIIFIFICLILYLIYILNNNNNVIYVSLGDSYALGVDSYGNINYGYSDYIGDNLKEREKLKFYTKKYAQRELSLSDINKDIAINKKIIIDDKKMNIRHLLRDASFVTLSAGIKDLDYEMNLVGNKQLTSNEQNQIISNIEKKLNKAVKEIKKYYQRDLYIIGYYNIYKNDLEKSLMLNKMNDMYADYAKKNKLIFIKTNDIFKNKSPYLENPSNIHPNKEGYKEISKRILKEYNKKNK